MKDQPSSLPPQAVMMQMINGKADANQALGSRTPHLKRHRWTASGIGLELHLLVLGCLHMLDAEDGWACQGVP